MTDNLIDVLKRDRFVLKPDLLLTANGPQRDHALVVEGSRVVSAGPAAELTAADQAAALTLSGHAIIPGFTDAHTHLGQTFGKILIGGEPAQIWRRLWVPMEAGIDDEAAYVSAKWQFLEQLRGGFTGVVN